MLNEWSPLEYRDALRTVKVQGLGPGGLKEVTPQLWKGKVLLLEKGA